MDKDIKMIYDEEAGGLKEYQEPYTKIDCATEDDFLFIKKQLNSTRKCSGSRLRIRRKLTKKVTANIFFLIS